MPKAVSQEYRFRMKILVVALFYVALALPLLGGRYRLNIDPETKEGYVLQQIKQERNSTKKFELMLSFVEEFPKDENLPWVLDQLLSIYSDNKDWDKVLATADRLLALQPQDHDAAFASLRAAEASNNPETIRKYSNLAWKAGELVLDTPKPKVQADVAAWQQNAEQARNLKLYAEYAVYSLSKGQDAQKREAALKQLEELNPRSVYLLAARQSTQKANQSIPAILDGLKTDPWNPDYLAVLADHYMRQNDLPKVVQFSGKLIEALNSHKPDSMTLAEWTAKRDRYLGHALWMNGVISSTLGQFHQADRSLRAALPYMRSNAKLLSAGLYHLGYVNYRLAELGEPNRVQEALKFNRECATLRGDFQEQAQKNILAIKSEYNLQ
ncbi:hypothetical protein F183_A45030 [Bryobacterales bacterium F-183]|nr:hypothetical protein F183_A45030 [Bryobacterales bacterium F-183]